MNHRGITISRLRSMLDDAAQCDDPDEKRIAVATARRELGHERHRHLPADIRQVIMDRVELLEIGVRRAETIASRCI